MPGQPARELTIEQYHRHDELLRERAELEAANAADEEWGIWCGSRIERIRAIDAELAA